MKNRFRDGAVGGGYRDLNVNVRFDGLICEVQIHVRAFYVLKAGAHPCYVLCRSLGLVGNAAEEAEAVAVRSVGTMTPDMLPLNLRLVLIALRWLVACDAAAFAVGYPYSMVRNDQLMPSEPMAFKIVLSAALGLPYSTVCFLVSRDLMRSMPSRAWACGVVVCGCSLSFFFAFMTGGDSFAMFVGIAVVWLLHVGAASVSLRLGRDRVRPRSRIAMLYDRFLGIDGSLFVVKVLSMQFFTVALQAPAKLPELGAAAWMTGAATRTQLFFQPALVPLFWVFLTALVVNSVFPALLLRSKSRRVQRDAVAAFDAVLDLVYFKTFMFATYFSGAYATQLPVTSYAYVACFWPLLHIFSVARSLESTAMRRRVREEAAEAAEVAAGRRNSRRPSITKALRRFSQHLSAKTGIDDAAESRLPLWAAVTYVVLSLGIVAVVLFTQCGTDRYPFGDWDHPCRPCKCDGNGVLVSCDVPAGLKVNSLILDNMMITDVKPGAFRNLEFAHTLGLSRNFITTLSEGMFVGLPFLLNLQLEESNITKIEPGAFEPLAGLERLNLRINRLTAGRSAIFSGLKSLRLLSLDSNGMRAVDADVFDDAPNLEVLWVAGNFLNCTEIIATTEDVGTNNNAGAVQCVDVGSCDYTDKHFNTIGDDICSDRYDTAECAWDGGDCS